MIRDEGYDVVCASRYMKGGAAGRRALAQENSVESWRGYRSTGWERCPRMTRPTRFGPTRRSVLQRFPIESTGGFEYSLELTAKAYAAGYRVGEVPSTWRDRSAGESRFKLRAWLPKYLKWYGYALSHRPGKFNTGPDRPDH